MAGNTFSVGAKAASDALVNRESARFMREILEKALTNPAGVARPWSAEAWASLANILATEYLNRWNEAGDAELRAAEKAVHQALAVDRKLALAYHANGLIHRAKGEHPAALRDFEQAIDLDPNFARAYAQRANQLILVGRAKEAPPLVERAIELSPNDPALGTFYWIMGRAFFYAKNHAAAIPWLRKSVAVQPNLWYNRLYLVSALRHAGEHVEATKTLKEFADHPHFGEHTLQRVKEYEKANPNDHDLVVTGRQNFHKGLQDTGMRAA